MFIAHLPAAYLIGKFIQRRWPQVFKPAAPAARATSLAWGALLLGSVAPDFDLLYFYLWSERSFNHHIYPPHVPIVWLATSLLGWLCLYQAPKAWRTVWVMFCIGWWSHLVLDTVAGGIWWLWPWISTPYVWIVLPRRFDHGVLNFLSHPACWMEVIIVVFAWRTWRLGHLGRLGRQGRKPSAPQAAELANLPLHRRVKFAVQIPKRPYRVFL